MTQDRYIKGTIERRGDVYFLRYREGGERKRARIGLVRNFPKQRDIERAAAVIRERLNGSASQLERRTMAALATRYEIEELPQRPSTAKNYRHYLKNHILPQWGTYELADIKAYDVRNWLRTIPLGDKTRSHVHGLMRILFRFAMLWEWYPQQENPMRLFKLAGATRRAKQPRVLTIEELHLLIKALDEPYRTMAIVCACLGLRCSELFGLQWGDIDWLDKKLTPRRAAVGKWIGEVKTKRSGKAIPLSDEVLAVLAAHKATLAGSEATDWVFPSPQRAGRKPYNAYAVQRYQLSPAAVSIGLGPNVGWHALRHSYRSWLDMIGTPVGVQRDLMRHTDIRTTMNVYGDSFMESLREPQQKIAKLVLQ